MKEVINEIVPSKKERERVDKLINNFIRKIKIKDALVLLGGSYAKNTWLSGNHDIDIYVAFNYDKYRKRNISTIVEKFLKKKFRNVGIIQGSRTYFQVKKEGFVFEIIPILNIKKVDDAENIMDISPFHVKWVKKHKKGNETRLTKAFFRAINCYGAESYKKSFSGYVLEILTVYYGSFDRLIKEGSKWRNKENIDVEKHGVKLNRSKTDSPLIIIDPVQNDRNAAAALSREKYNLFIESARQYLKKPSSDFFRKKDFDIMELRKKSKGKTAIILSVVAFKGRKDIIGCKILKAFEYLKKRLLEADFELIESGWIWDKKALLWYIFPKKQLSKFRVHMGPKLDFEEHVAEFRRKNKKYSFLSKNGRICAKIPRKYKKPILFIKNLINDDKNLKKYVKELEILK